jgi:surface protein
LWFETGPLVVVVCVVGLVFLFFVAPFSLLAVFYSASVFNQDVSKWITGAVTNMQSSKCTLSLPLCGHAFRCGVLLNIYDHSRLVGAQVSHVFVLVFGCGLKRDLVVVVFVVGGGFGFGLSFLCCFFLLAVFREASAFNQDVSKWNTGAVTTMQGGKCTLSLSLPLWPHGTCFPCGVLLNIYDNSRFFGGSQVSHVLFFLLFVV